MTRTWLATGAAALGLVLSVPSFAAAPENPPARPNFLIVLADDLGFSDIGAFGGEIDTPNLDALAARGVRLTGFHSAPTCSPTRSMLLTGTDNHIAGLGNMAELVADNQRGHPGYEGYLSRDTVSLAERLRAAGYRTLMAGKWHLGTAPEQDPHARGFDRSFALLQGGANHFGLGVSTDPAKGSTYTRDGTPLAALPPDFYSSDAFATQLIEELDETSAAGKPFFAYLAFTAPHWPLQALPSDIAKYRGRYDAGFEALRRQRLKRQAELGLIDPDVAAHEPVVPGGGWKALTPAQQADQIRRMEVYAAMVDRLDRNVGRVVAYLKQAGLYDNTIILFLSDNGAEGMDVASGALPRLQAVAAAADNSPGNLGAATSYASYGPGWAQAATAPSWLFKAYTSEGGTHVPAFFSSPRLTPPSGIGTAFGTVQDIVPTFLELAGLPPATPTFGGRRVAAVRGTSWAAYLRGESAQVHQPDETTGWELFGHRAIRQGDWKIVALAGGAWQLFNLAEDPGETRDLAAEQPERLERLVAAWRTYAAETGVILPDKSYQP